MDSTCEGNEFEVFEVVHGEVEAARRVHATGHQTHASDDPQTCQLQTLYLGSVHHHVPRHLPSSIYPLLTHPPLSHPSIYPLLTHPSFSSSIHLSLLSIQPFITHSSIIHPSTTDSLILKTQFFSHLFSN